MHKYRSGREQAGAVQMMSASALICTNKWEGGGGTSRDRRRPVTGSSLKPDAKLNQIRRRHHPSIHI